MLGGRWMGYEQNDHDCCTCSHDSWYSNHDLLVWNTYFWYNTLNPKPLPMQLGLFHLGPHRAVFLVNRAQEVERRKMLLVSYFARLLTQFHSLTIYDPDAVLLFHSAAVCSWHYKTPSVYKFFLPTFPPFMLCPVACVIHLFLNARSLKQVIVHLFTGTDLPARAQKYKTGKKSKSFDKRKHASGRAQALNTGWLSPWLQKVNSRWDLQEASANFGSLKSRSLKHSAMEAKLSQFHSKWPLSIHLKLMIPNGT